MHLDAPGTLTSPRHPERYPGNTDCQWTISTTKGQIIGLQFSMFRVSYELFSIFRKTKAISSRHVNKMINIAIYFRIIGSL